MNRLSISLAVPVVFLLLTACSVNLRDRLLAAPSPEVSPAAQMSPTAAQASPTVRQSTREPVVSGRERATSDAGNVAVELYRRNGRSVVNLTSVAVVRTAHGSTK